MIKQAFIILGLGYGDEGKGLTTSYLAKVHPNSIVIRFNGGHQAAHTVYYDIDKKHIFSCIGSGTIYGAPTYWSKHCTFSPILFWSEYKSLPVTPKIFIDIDCPITTHYDVLYNRAIELTRGANRHGSCGLGFGATVNRHNIDHVKLNISDILNSNSFNKKLAHINEYYKSKIEQETQYSFSQFDHRTEDIRLKKQSKRLCNYLKKVLCHLFAKEIFLM